MTSKRPKPDATEDVVLIGRELDEGRGRHVLRKRGERLEHGALRPLEDGKPLTGELVRLEPREAQPGLYDVHVELDARPEGSTASGEEERSEAHGPPQVATEEYRRGWDRLFGKSGRRSSSAN